jgi:hypothetical protein
MGFGAGAAPAQFCLVRQDLPGSLGNAGYAGASGANFNATPLMQ